MNNIKGILLAAGKGTRLMPATIPLSKPLLPIYDKPMIYYPLETLVRLGIKDILFIVQEDDISIFQKTFGTGNEVGLNFSYKIQKIQRGISDAYFIAENFLNGSPSILALSDNVFIGEKFLNYAKSAIEKMIQTGSSVFGLSVPDPKKFGVIELGKNNQILGIEEKPIEPKSNLIIPGMYFFDGQATSFVKQIKPSKRGELEITDLIEIYLKNNQLSLEILDESINWYDAGNAQSMLDVSIKVQKFEKDNLKKIGSYEIAAYEMGFINKKQFLQIGQKFSNSDYGEFLLKYIDNI